MDTVYAVTVEIFPYFLIPLSSLSLSLSLSLSTLHPPSTDETRVDFTTVDVLLAITAGVVGIVYFFTKVSLVHVYTCTLYVARHTIFTVQV